MFCEYSGSKIKAWDITTLDLIKPKLGKLVEFLKELEEVKPSGSFSEYKVSIGTKRSCERLIQLIVEVAADINSNIVVSIGQPVPRDYYDTFIKAGEVELISETLAKKLAPWASLRNRTVVWQKFPPLPQGEGLQPGGRSWQYSLSRGLYPEATCVPRPY